MMFQVGVVVGNPAPLLTNVTDIVAGNSASMHQKFKTFSRPVPLPATTPNPQQNIGKFSTLARVEKIPTATNSKEGLQAETDQEKSHLKDRSYFREQNNFLCKYDRKNCSSSTLWWSYSYFFKSWVMTAIKNIIPTTNYAFIKDGCANKIRVLIVWNA